METYSQQGDGSVVDSFGNNVPLNIIRKKLCQLYVTTQYGKLEFGNCISLPICVESLIKRALPDLNGEYIGFRDH